MIDLLFLACNRLEFTKASAASTLANTNWSKVYRVYLYDDNSEDGTRDYLESLEWPVERSWRPGKYGGPVAIMNHFLNLAEPRLFAKIDNDVLLPHGWLDDSLKVFLDNPQLDLLGIECRNDNPQNAPFGGRGYEEAIHIGGIGLMRGRAFERYGQPGADGRQGFTQWQHKHPEVIKGWLNPPLPVALLDHLPMEPWASLSAEYVRNGWERVTWGKYEQRSSKLWEWWAGAHQETAA